MKINLSESKNRFYIPDISVPTDSGTIENRKNDKADQIAARVTLASAGQKQDYLTSRNYVKVTKDKKTDNVVESTSKWDYAAAIPKHVIEIAGLKEIGVVDGKTLIAKETIYAMLPNLVQDLMLYICGMKDDDPVGNEGLSEGESNPSE